MKWGSLDIREFEKFQKKLEKMAKEEELQKLNEKAIKELAARFLRRVIELTPRGNYDKPVDFVTANGKEVKFTPKTGKQGGTLKRGWTAKTQEEAEKNKTDINSFLKGMVVQKRGDTYEITITNPVNYAEYVEYGHVSRNHKGWVEGLFMMTVTEEELRQDADKIVQKKFEAYLKRCFK